MSNFNEIIVSKAVCLVDCCIIKAQINSSNQTDTVSRLRLINYSSLRLFTKESRRIFQKTNTNFYAQPGYICKI